VEGVRLTGRLKKLWREVVDDCRIQKLTRRMPWTVVNRNSEQTTIPSVKLQLFVFSLLWTILFDEIRIQYYAYFRFEQNIQYRNNKNWLSVCFKHCAQLYYTVHISHCFMQQSTEYSCALQTELLYLQGVATKFIYMLATSWFNLRPEAKCQQNLIATLPQ